MRQWFLPRGLSDGYMVQMISLFSTSGLNPKTHTKKKATQPGDPFYFKSLAPLRANTLEPAAPRARAVRPRQGQTLDFVLPGLTLLSHGKPHATETTNPRTKKRATLTCDPFLIRSLAMTYSHMGKPHTTIGDASFHF